MDKKFDPYIYMLDLRGRKYLPVAARIAWFRTSYPTNAAIETEVVFTPNAMLVRARVSVDSAVIASGLATVRSGKGQTWEGREIEKAETAAIGRALAVAGFGTLNAFELDEGDYLSDAPATKTIPISQPTALKSKSEEKPASPDNSASSKSRPNLPPPAGYVPASPPLLEVLATFVEVCEASDGRLYIRAEGGATSWTREPFRKAGVPCEDWTKPGEKHILSHPVTVFFKEQDGFKSIVEVVAKKEGE